MRQTRLSEIENTLPSGLRADIQRVKDRLEDPVSVSTAAALLYISERQVHQLCQDGILIEERRRIRRVYKKSLIEYLLKRYGMPLVEVDNDAIAPQKHLEKSFK